MSGLSDESRWILALGAVVVAVGAWAFGRRQNHGRHLGGPISRPKLLWLAMIGYGWFLVPPAVVLAPGTPPSTALFVGVFWAAAVIRGGSEVTMLYIFKNWWPPIGIAHSALSFVWAALAVAESPREPTMYIAWTWAFVLWLAITAALETYFALLFYGIVRRRLDGDKGAWFAADGDPKFGRLNRFNSVANIPALVLLVVSVLGIWRS